MAIEPALDVVVVGGGPAGAAAGRLLAALGHSVRIVSKASDPSRGLGESLPPSAEKLLAEVGVFAAVQRAGFYRSTGNTVWWASRERRVETFAREALGYQLFRPDFDRVLLGSAVDAGADVRAAARVLNVRADPEGLAQVRYDHAGQSVTVSCRFVLDCSGRAGVVARRFRRAGRRMYALVGVWQRPDRWDLPDETHTVVETYDGGWAWSVPVSASTRHVGTMVDGISPEADGPPVLASAYRAELAKTDQLQRLLRTASLQRVWACDASSYCSDAYGGPHFLLVGDAGSFIDPLSSFGVKKALASAWLAAIAVHTSLIHPDRQTIALDFFTDWERDVYRTHVRRSRDFARAASERHPQAFWASRAEAAAADDDEAAAGSDADFARDPDVQAAFERLKQAPSIQLRLADGVRFEKSPIVRDHVIALEDAISMAGLKARTAPATLPSAVTSVRFLGNVDLVRLAGIAPQHRHIPDLFEAYCHACPPVPLPSVVGALSVLVARGVLREDAASGPGRASPRA